MHRTKELNLRDCRINLSLSPVKADFVTHLEHLSLSNTAIEMPNLQDPSTNPIKLRSFRLKGFSNIPANFKHLSQLEHLETLYVDKIPHFMTKFLGEHGKNLKALKDVTFDRSIEGLQPISTILWR